MSFQEALELMGEDESFRATVYAMNTLLIDKGFYTAEEFDALVIEHAQNYKRRKESARSGTSRETAHASL
jgi:hypothetical protein